MNKITERTIKQINKDRRSFLDMIGKAGISTSMLKASTLVGAMMSSRFVEAQSSQARKFVLIYHPNGSPNGRYLNGAAMTPFDAHRNDVSALEMTIQQPGNHGNLWLCAGAASYNGNDANSSSINMQIAKVIGNLTPYSSIQLGVQSLDQAGIDRLNGQQVTRINSPQTAFQRYFSSTPPPSGGGGGSSGPSVFDKRRDVLNANKVGLDVLRNKLGTNERDRLNTHLSALTTLENRIKQEEDRAASNNTGGNNTGGNTGACRTPTVGNGRSPLQEYRTQADIAVAALACNLTNVVSIQFNETQASWLANDGTADAVNWTQDHHQANHGNGSNHLPALVGYMNKGVAHLISGLKTAGIFNQTVVLVVSEMGDGQDHSAGNGPIVVASGINGFNGGQRRNVGSDHFNIFPDIISLMGLSGSAGGGQIHRYSGGRIVA